MTGATQRVEAFSFSSPEGEKNAAGGKNNYAMDSNVTHSFLFTLGTT